MRRSQFPHGDDRGMTTLGSGGGASFSYCAIPKRHPPSAGHSEAESFSLGVHLLQMVLPPMKKDHLELELNYP